MALLERRSIVFARNAGGDTAVISAVLFPPSERRRYPYALAVHVSSAADSDGFSTRASVNRANKEAAALISALGLLGAQHTGHALYSKRMVVGFASAAPGPATVTIRTGFFRKEEREVETRHDPNWSWYGAHLQPTPTEREGVQNQAQLEQLVGLGDVLSKPRSVDFTLTLPNGVDTASLRCQVEAAGFVFVSIGPSGGQTQCALALATSIEPETINGLCATLRSLAEGVGGDLDGWGCPVG